MNRIFTALCSFSILLTGSTASAQRSRKPAQNGPRYHTGIYHPRQAKKEPVYQAAYIGFSTGINNQVGLIGVQADLAFLPKFSLCTGIGISSWGYKTGLEGRYYFSEPNRGWAVTAGFTYNTGLNNVTLNNVETVGGDRTVSLKLHGMPAMSIGGAYFFNLGRAGRNRAHIQVGYAIRLWEPTYDRLDNQPSLTENSKSAINATAPGGFLLGAGFDFGTGSRRKSTDNRRRTAPASAQ